MKRYPEAVFAVLSAIVGIGLLIYGAHIQNGYWQSVLANSSVGLMCFALALFAVNVYIDRNSRRRAEHALFELTGKSLTETINQFLDLAHDRFGQPGFDQLTDSYQQNEWKPTALSPEEREKLATLVSEHRDKLSPLIGSLEVELKELCSVIGWSFDSNVLYMALSCRGAIGRYSRCQFDKSVEDNKAVCEAFLDVVLFASELADRLTPRHK